MYRLTISTDEVLPGRRMTLLQHHEPTLCGMSTGPMTSKLEETRAKLFGADGSMVLVFLGQRGPTRTTVSDVLEVVEWVTPPTPDNSMDGEHATLACALHYDPQGNFLAHLECCVTQGGQDIRLLHSPEALRKYRVGRRTGPLHTNPNIQEALQGALTEQATTHFHHPDLVLPGEDGGDQGETPVQQSTSCTSFDHDTARPFQSLSDVLNHVVARLVHPLWGIVPYVPFGTYSYARTTGRCCIGMRVSACTLFFR